ncbi:MAG: RadC family protein [Clostridia bacterium]|nr:RadC family protein [Clostridia bacterium]
MEKINKEHRQRVKKRFEKFGLDSFHDHEALELLLFFGLPYKNTNGMAHELINKFGSFSRVFSASKEELKSISGIGDHAAILIQLIPQLFRKYSMDLLSEEKSFDDRELLCEYVINHFIGQTKEHVQLFLFDSGMRRIDSIMLCEGTITNVNVNPETVAEHVFSNRASYFVLAHNHPSGNAEPSFEDLCITRSVWKALSELNREMVEHFVITGGKCMPVLAKAKELFDK